VKYPETNEMYARMMLVSRRLQTLEEQGKKGEWIDAARRELYRGQCNCAYWHGAFGGVYLPHLRNAIFNHLIAAENLLDRAIDKQPGVIERQAADLNLDGRPEVMVANDKLFCFVSPSCGGQMYELDVRSICHNLLATLTRRDEAYHHKVRQGQSAVNGEVASIHDRVVFKQANLDQRLQIDRVPRKSLIDHFYDHNVSLDAIARSEATEQGDFVGGEYEAKLRSHPDRVQIQLVREGQAAGKAIRITKAVTITTDQSLLDLVYQLEGLTPGETLHFSVEFNFAGMPAGADDRYFYQAGRKKLGQLGQQVALSDIREFGLIDEWLGLDVNLTADRPTSFWAYPVETVSQSEGGFELVHQSVAVQPHWFVQGDAEGRWAVKMRLAIDTRLAESRMEQAEAVSVS
jgi:alpha-amylase